MTSRKQWDETPCVGSRGPDQQMPLLANGSWTSVVNGVSWNKGWKWFLLVNVRQNVSDRQISRRICWKRQDLWFDWNFRGHLGQLCGFIDEHAEALEVHDHWSTQSFGGGIEAHLSPSQLQDRILLVLWNPGSCSPSATGSSEEWRGMRERHWGLHRWRHLKCPTADCPAPSHSVTVTGSVTPDGTWCFLSNSHEWCWAHMTVWFAQSVRNTLTMKVYHKAISCPPQNTGKSLENIKLLLHVSKEFMVF